MNGTRPLRLALLTAVAALTVGTVSLPSSAFAAPRASGALTAPAYLSDDSPDPDTDQDTDTGRSAGHPGNATGGREGDHNNPGGSATGGEMMYIKRTTMSADHPTTHIGEAPAEQRPYTTSSSPAARSSKVVLGF
ncbi:hypothetical protein [Streptomyces virginiae]|uniref:hypothetical protein n=1 Tax=Streptomyces virginiae TaxID=1961 RepID=UPI002DB6D9F4|nr:hypothetical protein [Streptomyces sp. CMAA1738]MEC4575757.1 hypothetical protein [Streptomyces sp. CMAA1738]